jgi:phenylalanyl-tRNA synthetase alpha chain
MTTKTPIVEQTLEQLGKAAPDEVMQLFAEVREQFDKQVAGEMDMVSWIKQRDAWLGRKSGVLTRITENWLNPAPPGLKRFVGQGLNELRAYVESHLKECRRAAEALTEQGSLAAARLDITLPGIAPPLGVKHIVRQTLEVMTEIFLSMGYQVAEGPEIETPYYNFEALNIPEHHPARDVMDTFYLNWPGVPPGSFLLRTHTSPVQVRWMEKHAPPVRIIVPGKVYRHDNPDATHSFMFHQIEGLAVDTDLTFCDFKGTIEYFVQAFLGPSVKTRFRPSYFPFTEPSAEVDGTCIFCQGEGCRVCKYSGWIELFGAGMVDPAVYGFVNYDAANLNGFAFGIGVERFAMLKYGINDIQVFFQNDVRFLRQFQ